MTRHDDVTRLRHMLDYAVEATQMAEGRQRRDLETDRQFCLALTHLVEIVGEAAARVSPNGHERWQSIPWRGVVGLRNRLIHGYDAVDLDILWTIVHDDLPPLIAELQHILDEQQK
ncbi:MAG: DUF86 domain-containing protein [Planctomycetaceae bacterium]|nr:MAG: DUF86 domain-containing protein [Planctomycetaceae bacterium]